ncbi:MAG: hypothetical protein WC246_02835 [Candidatus Paceibacterota bacterium]|jgi:hypothetical protein
MRKTYVLLFLALFVAAGSMMFIGSVEHAHAICAPDTDDPYTPSIYPFSTRGVVYIGTAPWDQSPARIQLNDTTPFSFYGSFNFTDCRFDTHYIGPFPVTSHSPAQDGDFRFVIKVKKQKHLGVIKPSVDTTVNPSQGWALSGGNATLKGDEGGYKANSDENPTEPAFRGFITASNSSLLGSYDSQGLYVLIKLQKFWVPQAGMPLAWYSGSVSAIPIEVVNTPPTAFLSAESLTVASGTATTLHWTTTNASNAFWLSGLIGNMSLDGSGNGSGSTGNLTTTTPFQFRARNSSGQSADSNTVTINVTPSVVNGSCTLQPTTQNGMSYASGATDWDSKPFCDGGTALPPNPPFPSVGGTTNWQCVGTGGGSTANCSATRSSQSCPGGKVTLSPNRFTMAGSLTAYEPQNWSGGTFSSNNTNVLTMFGSTGTGVSAGKATVTGSGWSVGGATNCSLAGAVGTVNGTFTIDALKTCTVGGTAHFDAYYSNNGVNTNTVTNSASWSSASSSIAVSVGNGNFNCLASGTVTVGATYLEEVTGSTLAASGSLTATSPSCLIGSVSANPTSIITGGTTQLSAPSGWSGGTYSSNYPSVLSISGSVGTGVSAGSANVSGSKWTDSNGTHNCSLSPVQVNVAPPCVPLWGPDPSTVCTGAQFTQTDSNNCETPNTRSSTGTGNCSYHACNASQQCALQTVAVPPAPASSCTTDPECGGGATTSAQLLINGSHNLTGANKIVVPYGQVATNLNIAWQATNANGCDASNTGGLQGWMQTLWNNLLKAFNSGSAISTVTQPGTYTFTINCH